MITFTIPGEPRGKGRPRATIRGRHAAVYTDAKTASYENLVKLAATQAMTGRAPFSEAVTVDVTVRLCPGASTSKRQRAAILAGEAAILGRFDLDNVVKAVTDGMNRIVFTDDKLIVGLTARKVGAETPGVDVRIEAAVFASVARAA